MNIGVRYPFTEQDMQAASEAWGCNCGPSALAFALGCKLDAARYYIREFDKKRYTSPTMMREAIEAAGRSLIAVKKERKQHRLSVDAMFDDQYMALTRIQWTGPWTRFDNPKWAYGCTHWIATWAERGVPLIFDCNGGIRGLPTWEAEIVPLITGSIPRADGNWYPTHVWRLFLP